MNFPQLNRATTSRLKRTAFAVGTATLLAFASVNFAVAAESVSVSVNMARILKISSPASTVIVGNPGIADVTIQDAQTLILTGKSFGTTNLIVLDPVGNPIVDTMVEVARGDDNLITVYQGQAKTSLACSPDCQPVIMLGDDTEFTATAMTSAGLVEQSAL